MAIRFVSFEYYKEILPPAFSHINEAASRNTGLVTFTAGLMSGLTEAILVVTPAEVCKIRMQAQFNSMVDPEVVKKRKYGNVIQTAVTLIKEEGPTALYKGKNTKRAAHLNKLDRGQTRHIFLTCHFTFGHCHYLHNTRYCTYDASSGLVSRLLLVK